MKKKGMRSIYQIRKELRLTQEELGQLLGRSRRTIARWEEDLVRMNLEEIKNEARLQGCPIQGDPGFKFRPIKEKAGYE